LAYGFGWPADCWSGLAANTAGATSFWFGCINERRFDMTLTLTDYNTHELSLPILLNTETILVTFVIG
jgi:hypothetical protein